MTADINIVLQGTNNTTAAFNAFESRLKSTQKLVQNISGTPLITKKSLNVKGVENVNKGLKDTAK